MAKPQLQSLLLRVCLVLIFKLIFFKLILQKQYDVFDELLLKSRIRNLFF